MLIKKKCQKGAKSIILKNQKVPLQRRCSPPFGQRFSQEFHHAWRRSNLTHEIETFNDLLRKNELFLFFHDTQRVGSADRGQR